MCHQTESLDQTHTVYFMWEIDWHIPLYVWMEKGVEQSTTSLLTSNHSFRRPDEMLAYNQKLLDECGPWILWGWTYHPFTDLNLHMPRDLSSTSNAILF